MVVHPGSRILTFYPSRIPDPRVKKAPNPGSGYATLKLLAVTVQNEPMVFWSRLTFGTNTGILKHVWKFLGLNGTRAKYLVLYKNKILKSKLVWNYSYPLLVSKMAGKPVVLIVNRQGIAWVASLGMPQKFIVIYLLIKNIIFSWPIWEVIVHLRTLKRDPR